MHAVALGSDPDGQGLGRVPRRVRQEIVENLDDPRAVGQYPRQVLGQVDAHHPVDGAAQEGAARLVHQRGDLGRLGRHRQRARHDASMVEQVADQAAHPIRLLVDDPKELQHLGRLGRWRGVQHGGRRALDRYQRRPQFVAHDAQELGAHPLQLLQRRQVLQGDHHRFHRPVRRTDRRGVDQGGDAAAVGKRERHLLGAHRLGAVQLLRHRKLRQGDLAPVGPPAGDQLQQLFGRAPRHVQALDDPPRLPVERHRLASPAEDHDAHRRCLDQGLQVGPHPPLVAVCASVGDGGRSLGGEQHQDLLVGVGELSRALLLGEKEDADVVVAVPHRRAQHRLRPHQIGGEAERPDIDRQVRQPQRGLEVAKVLEQPRPVGPVDHLLLLGRGEAGGDELLDVPCVVNSRDNPVTGAGEGAGAVDDLLQNGVEVEARTDAQDGGAQPGDAFLERLYLSPQCGGTVLHWFTSRARQSFACGSRLQRLSLFYRVLDAQYHD